MIDDMGKFRTSSATKTHVWDGRHRFEHWYRDNTVYFITSKARDGRQVFQSEKAKAIFWDRFEHYATKYGYTPWITSLVSNHYHTLGYMKIGENLGPMMRQLHGSVSKLVNDVLCDRHLPFFRTPGNHDYFDGCIRNALQASRAYRYTWFQSVRHNLSRDPRDYVHTKVKVLLQPALRRATQLNAFMEDVPYHRYLQSRPQKRTGRISNAVDWDPY